MKILVYIGGALSGVALGAGGALAQVVSDEGPGLGQVLYQQSCASCHGVNLEGQGDWRVRLPNGKLPAPPHDVTGHTWHHADRILIDIIKRGTAAVVGNGYQSDMPGFQDTLTDPEIAAILAYLKSTWPERARKVQQDVTQGDIEASK